MCVRMPFAGWFDVEVEADSRESAIEAAEAIDPEITRAGTLDWSLEPLRKIVQGNFFFADVNEVEVFDEDGNEVGE